MNPIDIAALAVLALSAAFGVGWGFVRMALGLAARAAAAALAPRLFASIYEFARKWIDAPQLAQIASYAVAFIVLLVVFSILAGIVGRAVQRSVVGGIDRALGLLFGAAFGAALIVAAYIGGNVLQPVGQWPPVVRGARATPLAYRGAVWAISLVPPRLRPNIEAPTASDQTVAS